MCASSTTAAALSVYVRGEEIVRGTAPRARVRGTWPPPWRWRWSSDVPVDEVARRLPTLPVAPHRLEQSVAAGGVVVLDDTYNANPAGGRAALATLERLGVDATRRVVVTPGMVELGPLQTKENARFAAHALSVATDLVVVGRTNRRALLRGARSAAEGTGSGRVVVVGTRQEATEWVRTHLGSGDVVLYENDLPDHYP